MSLFLYHQQYANYSDEEIKRKIKGKKEELKRIFSQVKLNTIGDFARIAVLGCGDKKFIKLHKKIFRGFINKPIELTTFDITIEHLKGGENVVQHDCTLPLPNSPFDIIYAHIILKFIETEKQWDLIKNSYDTLKSGGIAIHVMDKEDYETKTPLLPNYQFPVFSVPLNRWKAKLEEFNINYKEIPVQYGMAFVILKD